MARPSKSSGRHSSGTDLSASQTSKPESFIARSRLTPSEIDSLRGLSKQVNAVSLHGSSIVPGPNGHKPAQKSFDLPRDQLFVERRGQGDYAVRRSGSERASAIAPTQAEAIARAKEINPERPPLVERVRNADVGRRDKWRRA